MVKGNPLMAEIAKLMFAFIGLSWCFVRPVGSEAAPVKRVW